MSPIKTAQYLFFFKTLKHSFENNLICSKNSFNSNNDRSPSIPLLYFIILEYGGCANIKSIQLSGTIAFKLVESALINFGSYKLSLLKLIRSFAILRAFIFTSIPHSFST